MNRICAVGLTVLFFLFAGNGSFAQSHEHVVSITPYKVNISYSKTTNLLFPYAIKSVDRGSSAVIVQKAKGVENILQVKAAKKDFEPTNLTVVTADGRFYSFVVHYADQPSPLNISFIGDHPALFSGLATNARQLEKESWQVLGIKPVIRLQRTRQALRLGLNGIYHSENNFWLKLRLHNGAPVDFKPAYVRFFLLDKKRVKRTAQQETEILPIYAPDYESTKRRTSSVWPVGFRPFTVPKHQQLIIQIGDQSGGRVIHLPVKSRLLLRAQRIPS